ncbi:MAG: hypothetical protein ACUZ8E_07290 [Candidatus Anammoxibacter sp.]
MANTITITKTAKGVILVNNDGDEYTLLPDYRIRKKNGNVEILNDLGGMIDTFTPNDVEKVILSDGSEIVINDIDTLFTQLMTNFFFKLTGSGDGIEFISDANSSLGQDGNYRFEMVAGKLQTQKLIASVWTVMEEI